MDIIDYLKQAGGVARSAQLLNAGFPRRELLRLQESGASQPRRGVFVLPECDEGILGAVLNNGRLSCASAAAHYGLWLRKPPARLHLACNHGHGSGFVRHRTIRLQGHPLLPVAAVEDVALHALGCLPTPASTAMATSAIRLHGVPRELLASQLLADRSGTARRVLREVDIRAESIVEVDLQHLFQKRGIEYASQDFLPGIGRVDFLLGGFLIVEVDGFAFHSKRGDMLRDRERNNASAVSGYAVLRYMPEHIWFNSGQVISEIRTVLAAGQRKPGQRLCSPAQLLPRECTASCGIPGRRAAPR
ncbi:MULTISPECIES: DUF559 domain-containing protein [unclassified Arthrobacter]|uniref:DUF559 domain-containing protein n=1 Tax=unclassified Arthrobacter TaxID=235627 RepID=UPI001C84169A|nr:DUF559 domain-containing protein [Arthrobacter sp. MAHUQ-56]MBX7445771.1 endonuclease domain-containing protein [Arthrobacter sp. MAHUQ-56]